MRPTENMLTIDDLAALCGVKRKTVEAWNTLGKAPRRTHVGRRTLYRRADVNAWMAARVHTAAPTPAAVAPVAEQLAEIRRLRAALDANEAERRELLAGIEIALSGITAATVETATDPR